MRALLPPQINSEFIYLKLFKNIPRTDLEMIFPNTRIKFRLFDKLKLGVTAGGGLGAGIVGTAGKIAVATNPIALAGALLGLGGVALRQGMNFVNQKNRYMVTMAQNLYFHAMADNRGVMTLLADRAAEEDIKEEMLLYAVLAKERVNIRDIGEIDAAIEQYLRAHLRDRRRFRCARCARPIDGRRHRHRKRLTGHLSLLRQAMRHDTSMRCGIPTSITSPILPLERVWNSRVARMARLHWRRVRPWSRRDGRVRAMAG